MRQTSNRLSAAQIEAWLIAKLTQRLGVSPHEVDRQESFLRYGLDSLAALETVADLEDWLACKLPLTLLWDYPTLAESAAYIATVVQDSTSDTHADSNPMLATPDGESVYEAPLSLGQQALWLLQQHTPDNTAYNIACAVRIPGTLNVPALQQALRHLVTRHAALRTTFPSVHGQPVQRIHPPGDLCFHVEHASTWSATELTAYLTAAAHRPFLLESALPYRITLLRCAADEHVLLLVLHHIIADFWSLEVFVHELGLLYASTQAQSPLCLPPLTQQYTDYVHWQSAMLTDTAGERHWAYWQEHLAAPLPVLNLPTDHPRPPQQTWRGAAQSQYLSHALTQQLKALSQGHENTLYTTLLSAFYILLYRYTGQDDILVGSPMACRGQSGWSDVMGYFANPVVLRARPQGTQTFSELLAQVRQAALAAFEHQHYPFPALVERLQPERDPSRNPLFQAMFVWQQARPLNDRSLVALALGTVEAQIHLPGFTLQALPLTQQTAQCDLTLSMAEVQGALVTSVQYNTDLFDAATISRLLGHWTTLLEGIVADPQQEIATLPLLTPAERHQLLNVWNATSAPYAFEQCLHQLVEAQVVRTPERIAVTCEGRHMTYRELNQRANQLAHYLQRLGVGPEVLVGLCMERSLEMVIGLLGVLKAGGAYVPLDPDYPQERLAFMLDDAEVPILLTQTHVRARLPEQLPQLLCLDTDWPILQTESTANPEPSATATHLAYVIYTSGSTGKPKGALNTHRGICNRLLWMQDTYQLTVADRVLQKTPLSFDVSVWEVFWPLLSGARLVLARPEGHRDSAYLIDLITTQRITVLHFVPAMLQVFLEAQDVEQCQSLRHVICSGEALTVDLQERCWARLQQAALHNLYGPTEAAIDVTFWPCVPDRSRRTVPIGRPIANTQIYLLDERLQPVPIGVPAELHIGGVGLARGYLKRPELTASRFIAHPYSDDPTACLYKTGDLARHAPDGSIEYLGRLDHQVKLHGFRIELGEIEAVLAQHPGVRDSVVLLRDDAAGEPLLVAYVVPQQQPAPSHEALRDFLRTSLPIYMVPAVFVWLAAMPLSANGKIERRQLPAPTRHRPTLARPFVAPRTPIEAILATAWSQVLGVAQVSVLDNFFDLGGDSIRSLRICAQAQQAGVTVSIQHLYRYQTIAAIAAALQDETPEPGLTVTAPAFSLVDPTDQLRLPATVVDAYPAAALQTGMLFHSALHSASGTYHDLFSFHLQMPWDETACQQAAQLLASRHPILRTAFDLTHYSTPLQLVQAEVVVPVHSADWRHLTNAEQEEHLALWRAREKQHGFDWSTAPLWRLFIHRRSTTALQFTLSFHHAILDGWSVATLLTEFLQTYLHLLHQAPAPEAMPATTSYADFVALERLSMQSEATQQYWQQHLADATRTTVFPPITTTPEQAVPETHSLSLPVAAELCAALYQLAQETGVPIKTVLLTAHLRALSLLSGEDDVLTGVVTHGRPEGTGSERLLGLFLNTMPFRMRLEDTSWANLIRQTFAMERACFPFRRYPLAALQRRHGGQPLFDVVFDYTHFHIYQQLEAHGAVQVLDTEIFEQTNFPLYVRWMRGSTDTSLTLHLHYDVSVVSRERMQALQQCYTTILQTMVSQPDSLHTAHSFLAPAEAQQVVQTWNATQADYPDTQCLHELFEAQVQRSPDAVALVWADTTLTYRELNHRANQLARYLRSLGIGREGLVGLYCDRSVDMIVGILGILKAGGAYVPLDPTYPPERLRFMLADTKARVLLTQHHLHTQLPGTPGTTQVCLDTDWPRIAQTSGAALASGTTPDNLAYVLYTSGSTGQPKGVMGLHRGAVNRCAWMWRAYPFTEAEVACHKTSFNFVDSVWELFGPLLQGVRVVLLPHDVVRDPERLVQTLATHHISRIVLVPSLLRMLLDTYPDLAARIPTLRLWISSGEVLPLDLARRFRTMFPDGILLNLYGSSEVAADVTCYDTRLLNDSHHSVPIGSPLANTQIYLLDAHCQPVPVGVPGDLYVGGAGLARGYLHRPTLTAAQFLPHPFDPQASARLYKTGDRARYLPDGTLEYLGRLDQQIKLRGIRIELGEIEAALLQHPAVQQAVVLARTENNSNTRLLAYVVPVAGTALATQALRQFLQQRLPDVMLPAAFVTLPRLPLTPNGKVDRQALMDLPTEAAPVLPAGAAPRTPLETTLATLWRELLHTLQVHRHDNFFALGGDSLLAVQLMCRIEHTLGRRLPLATLLQAPTLAALATALSTSTLPSLLVPIQAGGSKPPLFCLHAAGGQVLAYQHLATLLGADQTVYGVQSCVLTGASQELPDLDAMADSYTTAIRAQQPAGPYHLLGWSMGGVLALAVAHRLEAQGQTVAFVGLIDAYPPAHVQQTTGAEPLLALAMACGGTLMQALMHLDPVTQEDLRKALYRLSPVARATYLQNWARDHAVETVDLPPDVLLQHATLITTHLHHLTNHAVQPLHAAIHTWWAREGLTPHSWQQPWQHATPGQITTVMVPGNHFTCLQSSHVQTLAQQIALCLQRAHR